MRYLPGLTISIGAPLPGFYDGLQRAGGHLATDCFEAGGLCGILRRFPQNRAAGLHLDNDRKAGLAVDAGPDLRIGEERATPEKLLDGYLKWGPEFVKSLDGQFLLIAWDRAKGEVLLASDRYGLRPHYRRRLNGGVLIGASAQELARLEERPLKLDERSIFAMLSYSRVSPGGITWFEDFEALPPATQMVWSHGLLTEETRYWDYFGTPPRASDDAVDEIADAFRAAVCNSMDTGIRTGICLSGGLDSRIVLAAMTAERRQSAIAYTWGAKRQSDEVAIAGQIAEHAGIDWRFVQMAPADFVTDLEGAVNVLEGRDLAIQGYSRKAFNEVARDCGAATTGLALDILLSGSYASFLVDGELGKIPFEQSKDGILDRYRYFKFPLDQMFQNSVLAGERISEVRNLLKQDLTEVSDDRGNNLDRFILRQRGWRYLSPRQQWQRLFVEDVTPTYANRLIDHISLLPSKERANYSLTRKILERLDSALMRIPYQGTLMPVSVPVEFWKSATSIEAQKEALYRNIYHTTNGQVFLPYERYYTNFDEWQRSDPSWSKTLEHYLLSDDSRLASKYLRPDWIKALIADQRSGAAANYARINVLISIELLLRRYS
jgi:asparagine synthase (glutamine-hydrolysing)